MKPFFILGLPRSRTAWMSAWTSTDLSVCYHDPVHLFSSVAGMARFMAEKRQPFVGISSVGLHLHAHDILDKIKPRTLLIERDPEQCDASLTEILGWSNLQLLQELSQDMKSLRSHPLVMPISFDAMDDSRSMRLVWEHLLPGLPFDLERFERMCNLRIVDHDEKMLALYQSNPQAFRWVKEKEHA